MGDGAHPQGRNAVEDRPVARWAGGARVPNEAHCRRVNPNCSSWAIRGHIKRSSQSGRCQADDAVGLRLGPPVLGLAAYPGSNVYLWAIGGDLRRAYMPREAFRGRVIPRLTCHAPTCLHRKSHSRMWPPAPPLSAPPA